MSLLDKVKQKTWDIIYEFFPTFQKFFLRFHQKGRQRFHIGWLAPGKTLEELKIHLHSKWGFGNHFVAWPDEGQVLSWRKLLDFQDQYHLRVFEDGEIRGHFEYTPEAHPIEHFEERGEDFHREEFLKFLGEFVSDTKTPEMHLVLDPDSFNPHSEISIENEKITA